MKNMIEKSVSLLSRRSNSIILLVLFLVPVIIVWLFLSRSKERIVVRYKVIADSTWTSPINFEYAKNFSVGDAEYNELGFKTSEIVAINKYPIDTYTVNLILDIEQDATYNPRKKMFSSKGRAIVFGEPTIFVMNSQKFKAMPIEILESNFDTKSFERKKITLSTQLWRESRDFSEVFGENNQIATSLVQDFKNGNLSVDHLNLIDVSAQPAERLTLDQGGSPKVVKDPFYSDVFLTFELDALVDDDQLIVYEEIPIHVGATFPVNLGKYVFWVRVLDVKE